MTPTIGSIGFIGLGQMGLPIAKRLLAAGHQVVAFDQRAELRPAIEAAGARWASSPREVADLCPMVMVCLPTPAAVQAVALGDQGLVHGSALKLYVDLSTTGPQMAKEVAARMRQRGIVAMDAPVSGGVAGAERGTLAIMVAGPLERLEELRPVLAGFGANVFHVGEEPGMGQLINNLLSTTTLAATFEVLTLGVKGGLDPKKMLDVLAVSSGTNHAVETKIPNYLLRNVPMGFSLDLSYKDVRLCVEAGEALDLPMHMGRMTQQIWQDAIDRSGPKQDYLQVVKLFEDRAGVQWTGDPVPLAQ